MPNKIAFALILLPFLAAAQPAITNSAYLPPAPVPTAPGQISTFYAAGIGMNISQSVRAPAGQLPSTLAGITVTLRQGSTVTPVPILEVRPVSPCPTVLSAQDPDPASSAGLNLCATFLGVTVQIPYEFRPDAATPGILFIGDSRAKSAIELTPLADQIHVLTMCDLFLNATQPPPSFTAGLPCSPYVSHTDGTLVSASAPAKIGETVIAWAVGLGATTPAANTGQPATRPLPTATSFSLRFDYKVNALPARPYSVTLPLPGPAYTGLSTSYPGLYQINFVIPPEPLQGTPRCILPGVGISAQGNYPVSNLTVSFGGSASFGGAGICVDTHIPVD